MLLSTSLPAHQLSQPFSPTHPQDQLNDRHQYEWQALQRVQELEWEEQAKVAHARVAFPFLPVSERKISVTELLQCTLGLV